MSATADATDDATSPDPAELAARREAAIEESGWGSRFHLFQPRNLCLWVLLLLLVLGARQLYGIAAPLAGVFADADLAAVASSGPSCWSSCCSCTTSTATSAPRPCWRRLRSSAAGWARRGRWRCRATPP
ncbi:hypothetical protein [Nocardioides sambongensis]|uniref:hypothetical protein n=1 Tax=Nocardioides sambongensis TaxID=2589074 RepID=UPI001E55D2F2|nr:hypothetical protein [Nocardioides sambongensis]